MYADDSFLTLSVPGRIGLVLVSGVLTSVMALILWRALRVFDAVRMTWRVALRGATAMALFWVFVWLSPQIYYLYYQLLFETLPWQGVVGQPPNPRTLIDLLVFRAGDHLADHARGVLGWLLLAQALAVRHRPSTA